MIKDPKWWAKTLTVLITCVFITGIVAIFSWLFHQDYWHVLIIFVMIEAIISGIDARRDWPVDRDEKKDA